MKTNNEQKVINRTAQIEKMNNSKSMNMQNKSVVSAKNANSTESSKKVLASLKVSINNLCNGKSFLGLSFSKETAQWLIENRCTDSERILCFNKLNKVDYEKLINLITKVQRAFAKEAGKDKILKGLAGNEYCVVYDNNLRGLMW